MLRESGVRPVLDAEGGLPRPAWAVEEGRRAVIAAAAVTLWHFLGDHGFDRIGVCTGRRCADVYVDVSPGGRRRFCSVTCQNRARVAAFRSRRAADGQPKS
ncbi:CGNR zinc finger domain-containing protein [Streptomyces sp. SID14478]|nr:CGNR zinc finger domain-containing protein [Streptomyces sp. SID14478]